MQIVELGSIPKLEDIKDVPLDEPVEVYKVCRQMEDICEKAEGIGLSAVQVGIPWRLFIVKSDGCNPFVPKGKYGYFVNCDYEPLTEQQVDSLEGCLSVRSNDDQLRLFWVKRYTKIRLYGKKLIEDMLKYESIDSEVGFQQQAVVFQHEADHHKGLTILDHGKEIFVF